MPSKSSLTLSVASAAVAALFAGGAYAVTASPSEPDAQPTISVVNKTGHEVDENAADGQARATEARSTGETKRAEKQAERDARKAEQKAERDARKADQKEDQPAENDSDGTDDTDDTDDTSDEATPADSSDAAEADDTDLKDRDHQQGPKQGPNEKAGDKPDENAFAHPGDRSAQGPKGRRGPSENAGDHPNDNASKDRSNQREERGAESGKK
ncbi:hypothetical protein GCM10027020_16650 [Nocardioides salsibiostraticola]